MSGWAVSSVELDVRGVLGEVRRGDGRRGPRPGRAPRRSTGSAVTISPSLEADGAVLRRACRPRRPARSSAASSAASSTVDDRVEVVAAGVVVPEPLRAPALLAAGLGDRGGVVDREPGLGRVDACSRLPSTVTVIGAVDPVGEPVASACLGLVGGPAADVDAGDGGAARHLVAGGDVRRGVRPADAAARSTSSISDDDLARRSPSRGLRGAAASRRHPRSTRRAVAPPARGSVAIAERRSSDHAEPEQRRSRAQSAADQVVALGPRDRQPARPARPSRARTAAGPPAARAARTTVAAVAATPSARPHQQLVQRDRARPR